MTTKITLATLAQASAQQVFDQVSKHLLTQMQQSMESCFSDYSTGGCMYHNPQGLQCAAGSLISPEEYQEALDKDKCLPPRGFEFKTWPVLKAYKMIPSAHFKLITALQQVHDANEPHLWWEMLHETAQQHGLNTQVLKEFE